MKNCRDCLVENYLSKSFKCDKNANFYRRSDGVTIAQLPCKVTNIDFFTFILYSYFKLFY